MCLSVVLYMHKISRDVISRFPQSTTYHLHSFILEFSVIKVWHASIGKLNMHKRLHLTIASDDRTHEVYTLLASVTEVVLKVVARLTTLLRLTSYTFQSILYGPNSGL